MNEDKHLLAGICKRNPEARLPSDPNVTLVEIIEIGQATEKDGYWTIPVKSREAGGRIKDGQTPIKFYEFDGVRYCMIMWPG